jgi:hypothetical protein
MLARLHGGVLIIAISAPGGIVFRDFVRILPLGVVNVSKTCSQVWDLCFFAASSVVGGLRMRVEDLRRFQDLLDGGGVLDVGDRYLRLVLWTQ